MTTTKTIDEALRIADVPDDRLAAERVTVDAALTALRALAYALRQYRGDNADPRSTEVPDLDRAIEAANVWNDGINSGIPHHWDLRAGVALLRRLRELEHQQAQGDTAAIVAFHHELAVTDRLQRLATLESSTICTSVSDGAVHVWLMRNDRAHQQWASGRGATFTQAAETLLDDVRTGAKRAMDTARRRLAVVTPDEVSQ